MKQSEKLDLILRELYKYKNDGRFYSFKEIFQTINIPFDSIDELLSLGERLEDDRYINASFTNGDCVAKLTSYGIEYCEDDSYSYSGHSVVTNNYSISIANSPNANIVSQSSDVKITQNVSNVNESIEKIRETVMVDDTIDRNKATEILDCLNEIQEAIKNNQKPKFAIKSLLDIAGGISSIASWITTLGQFAGIIPPIPL